jgi:hypothetical protein
LVISLIDHPLETVVFEEMCWLHDCVDYVAAAMDHSMLLPEIPADSPVVSAIA